MLLSDLKSGEIGIIVKVRGQNAFRKRISEMGFIRGKRITVIKNAPLNDPVEYSVMGYMVSLRRQEASLIEVISEELLSHSFGDVMFHGTFETYNSVPEIRKAGKTINIAMAGNPNSGKTSIFNIASRSYEKVGNYGGVTVGSKMARFEYQGYTLNIFDLPGTYSLTTYSPEEIYVRNFLFENQPDIVINVVDSTNLERNLYLTTQLLDMNIKIVIALNMFDELKKKGIKFDHRAFGDMIGVPVVPTVGSRGKGIAMLFEAVIKKYNESEEKRRRINIHYGKDVENSITRIQNEFSAIGPISLTDRFCQRFLAIKLIVKDEDIKKRILEITDGKSIIAVAEKEISQLELNTGYDTETLITDSKYGFIAGALKETLVNREGNQKGRSEKIDRVLTHKYAGIPLFLVMLWGTFLITFRFGKYPAGWIDDGIQWISVLSASVFPPGALNDLFQNGILGGVGGVLVFLPNILLLFFFISLMEDTGYMARAAFIMDKFMHRIGLHGKSFIPLLMGFGCNVPAILSTRIIESRNNRLVTMLIIPYMSCSARLPIYILIIGAFFPAWQGTILFLVYLTGIILAAISALVYRKVFFKGEDIPFVMELPPYRMPTIRNTLRHMWGQSSEYLKRIGGVIILASIIIWGLNYFPVNSRIISENAEIKITSEIHETSRVIRTDSYLERFGKFIEPVMKPLGFDWKMSVSLIAGIPGKEIIVSTMGVLYGSDEKTGVKPLGERIKDEKFIDGSRQGENVFNPLTGITFIIFILIYFPCVAVAATIARETAEVKWAVFLVLYTTVLAWLVSFIIYQSGKFLFL